jgi:hypothetical protein
MLEQDQRVLFFKLWRDLEGPNGKLDQDLRSLAEDHPTQQPDFRWLRQVLQSLEVRWRREGKLPKARRTLYSLLGSVPFSAVLLLLLVLGAASFYLGSGGSIHLFANPFIMLLLWHLTLYLGKLIFQLWRMGTKQGEPLLAKLSGYFVPTSPPTEQTEVSWKRVRHHMRLQQWQYFKRSTFAEVYAKLHASSLVLTLGVIIGLYLNGLLRAYNFTWDSTFIHDEVTVRQILLILFWPLASLRTWFELSPLPPLSGSNGAAWIHFYAQAAMLYILLPRCAMLVHCLKQRTLQSQETHLLHQHFKLDSWAHFLSGSKPELTVIGYSFRLDASLQQAALSALEEHLEGEVVSTFYDLEWGDDAEEIPVQSTPSPMPQWLAVCFNAAQTPEEDIHGIFLNGISGRTKIPANRIIVLLDTTKLDPTRGSDRLNVWQQLIQEAELQHSISTPLGRQEDWQA